MTNSKDTTNEFTELPNKRWFLLTDLARYAAPKLGISESAARMRIYRRVVTGEIPTRRVLGSTVIDRSEAIKIIRGTPQP